MPPGLTGGSMFTRTRLAAAGAAVLLPAAGLAASATQAATTAAAHLPALVPMVAEWTQVSSSETPPTQAQCFSAGRRCFDPASTRAAYNLGPLYAQGYDGHGKT